jgi:hypothetical protein
MMDAADDLRHVLWTKFHSFVSKGTSISPDRHVPSGLVWGQSPNRARGDAAGPGSSGAGVRAVVDAPQAAAVHVAVQLGGRERAVAEELLDRAEVGAALQEVRRERVA